MLIENWFEWSELVSNKTQVYPTCEVNAART
ncbi:hypothetical protein J2T21_001995 [Paeniglutamicibacter psychrophenolicus]|uniref:Uncharacterized protein n=1 Tax=Paeniglutamicibacter psychrophenolicus TaxID=257454 RepID=A0ABS4WFW8_9MICC|nr:hypothetical protein [Paeniglutamicibacter psychrophenolicus]MDQ0094115.1 hypothetical protein [Paeniglutamicibacter psychrophenolicus]